MKNKNIIKIIVFCLVIAMLSSTIGFAAEVTAPAQLVKSAASNSEIAFTLDEILNLFDQNKKVTAITFTSMPDLQSGILKVENEELLIMENVKKKEISKLRFIPVKDFEGEVTLELKALDKKNNHIGTATIKLCMLPEPNYPPSAKDGQNATQKNIQITGKLFGADPENDIMTFDLIKEPKKGTVEFFAETNGYVYTPNENKTGVDTFTYQVSDQYGNKSEVATMKIRINKPESTLTYADMEDHWAHYPAIKLAEADIMAGTQVGNNNFFDPDGQVTRGEFMVMLLQATKPDLSVTTVSQTSFMDDETIPAWMKGYVTAAVANNIVSGQGYEDGVAFDAMAPITRAQACVMLNNALVPSETIQTLSSFSDIAEIPVWAMEAVTAMSTCGILNGFEDNTVRPQQCLTRAQACSLLWDAINYMEENKPASSFNLFSWFQK